jgi:hypothetical protein
MASERLVIEAPTTAGSARCAELAIASLSRAIKALETELGGELPRHERVLSHLRGSASACSRILRQSCERSLTAKMVAASSRAE